MLQHIEVLYHWQSTSQGFSYLWSTWFENIKWTILEMNNFQALYCILIWISWWNLIFYPAPTYPGCELSLCLVHLFCIPNWLISDLVAIFVIRLTSWYPCVYVQVNIFRNTPKHKSSNNGNSIILYWHSYYQSHIVPNL